MDAARDSTLPSRFWVMPAGFVVAALLMLPFDMQISASFQGERSRSMSEFLEISEAYGHGFGATLILIAAAVLGPVKWRYLPLVISGSLGAGMVANIMKVVVRRSRPRDYDLLSNAVWDTFVRGTNTSNPMQSMPSAHTATAVGLSIVLATLFPRGRYLFVILAVLVGFQRIATRAHYPSDVFAGAAVGSLIGIWSALLLRRSSDVINDEQTTRHPL